MQAQRYRLAHAPQPPDRAGCSTLSLRSYLSKGRSDGTQEDIHRSALQGGTPERDRPIDQDRPRRQAGEEHRGRPAARPRGRVAEAVAMSDDPEAERIARLIDELRELPADEREAAIEALSIEDRAAVWAAELEESDAAVQKEDDEELGGEA